MIYIQQYSTADFTEKSEQLKKEFNLLDVQKATKIKSKNLIFNLFLFTLKWKVPFIYLSIHGEQTKTKVCKYYEGPMNCKKKSWVRKHIENKSENCDKINANRNNTGQNKVGLYKPPIKVSLLQWKPHKLLQ